MNRNTTNYCPISTNSNRQIGLLLALTKEGKPLSLLIVTIINVLKEIRIKPNTQYMLWVCVYSDIAKLTFLKVRHIYIQAYPRYVIHYFNPTTLVNQAATWYPCITVIRFTERHNPICRISDLQGEKHRKKLNLYKHLPYSYLTAGILCRV